MDFSVVVIKLLSTWGSNCSSHASLRSALELQLLPLVLRNLITTTPKSTYMYIIICTVYWFIELVHIPKILPNQKMRTYSYLWITLWLRCANYCLFWVACIFFISLCMQKKFDFIHHLLSNYYCNYQNYHQIIVIWGINVRTNKQ